MRPERRRSAAIQSPPPSHPPDASAHRGAARASPAQPSPALCGSAGQHHAHTPTACLAHPALRYTVINVVEHMRTNPPPTRPRWRNGRMQRPVDDFLYHSRVWEERDFWPDGLERPKECHRYRPTNCSMQSDNDAIGGAWEGWNQNFVAEEYVTPVRPRTAPSLITQPGFLLPPRPTLTRPRVGTPRSTSSGCACGSMDESSSSLCDAVTLGGTRCASSSTRATGWARTIRRPREAGCATPPHSACTMEPSTVRARQNPLDPLDLLAP